ncbi:synaptic vesicle glycoprotein 2B-like isoform X2 [Homalodisca vitripennis]|uniref:synaptic vesicle glycoprotein 2B-like isoform X2 n=1 Tax=Homalodisca vitripennis TaxID=197043 RepID=UPI001EECDEF6|nr:synaptic vesicle glycoprotein 2B-like isoform X2 [Homalodisca vitripennis]
MPETKEKAEDLRFEDAMEIAGYGKFSMYIIFLSGLTVSTSLMGSVDVSFLLPAAECDLNLTSDDKGLLGSSYYIGGMLASHLAGFLADTLGRRHVLVRALLWNVLTYILGSLAPNIWIFIVFKLISGILLSPPMIATLPFLGEFVPAKRRAQALLVTSSLSTLGILYSSLAGWMTLRGSWAVDLWFVTFTPWRLFYLVCGLPSLLCGTLFYFTPESPKFLLTRGKKGDTMKILQRVHSVNSGKLPHTFPVESVSMDTDEISPPARGKGIVGALKHIGNQTLPVFKPPYLRNLSLCIVIAFISFLCVNGVYLWLPEVTNRIAQYKDTHEGRFYVCEMLKKGPAANVTSVSEEHSGCQISSHTAVFVPSLLVATVQPFIILIASTVVLFKSDAVSLLI